MLRIILAVLLCIAGGAAHATHMQNVNSGLCINSAAQQTACAATPVVQDVSFAPVSGGRQLKIGGKCLKASAGSVGAAVSAAFCDTTNGSIWTVYKATSTSTTQQYQNKLGNCLGLGANSTSSGAALALMACASAASVEWSSTIEFVHGENGDATTAPTFAISGGNLGAATGSTVAVGAQLDCGVFVSGAYCALASDHTKAATGRPYADRLVASNVPIVPILRVSASPSSIPTPASVAALGLPVVGQIIAKTGDVISGKHIMVSVGPCVIIPSGVHDVTIQDNEIGPCTSPNPATEGGLNDRGILTQNTGANILVQRNVIHDVSVGLLFQSGNSLQFLKNYVYNVLGPVWQGQMIQVGNLAPGPSQNKINCNKYDGLYTVGQVRSVRKEDTINLIGSTRGDASNYLEVAYNHMQGPAIGGGDSGSAIEIGDLPTAQTGFINVHHNDVWSTNGGAVTVTGGDNIILDSNNVDNRGPDAGYKTGQSFNWDSGYPTMKMCTNLTVTNNHGVTYQWYYNQPGTHVPGANEGNCTPLTKSGNNFDDTSLPGAALFTNAMNAACN